MARKGTKRKIVILGKDGEKNEETAKTLKEMRTLAQSIGNETSGVLETACCVRFDDNSVKIFTGRIDPITKDVFDTNSNSSKNETPYDAPVSIL